MRNSTSIATVARNVLDHFSEALYPQAVRIFTPFPERVPLAKLKIKPALRKFIESYEPNASEYGLFPHQAQFLEKYLQGDAANFILTTATGSGKSLCFWTWVFDHLLQDPQATALLCFPTQALMWSQAERLVRVSDSQSLVSYQGRESIAYGGSVKLGRNVIPWTIWHGTGHGETTDHVMQNHQKSKEFASARIRIATVDKVEWSLMNWYNHDYLANLECLVLDEAHIYDGVFGANVHYLLKRIYMGREILGRKRPHVFLASATLSSAGEFGKTLLSLDDANIVHIQDSTKQQIDLVPASQVPAELSNPPADGLLRIVFLLDGQQGDTSILPFMRDDKQLGTKVNAIYFSQSKFHSKLLAHDMQRKGGKREEPVIYDADLPPQKRREIEKELNSPQTEGKTVLATSAMELGVDIEGLDICFIEEIPSRRADMLQRIGRVGRRAKLPGLVLMCLSVEPQDQNILEDPRTAFRLDLTRPVPIPLHLEMVKWRHILAAQYEWQKWLGREVRWSDFNRALENQFGESLVHVENQFDDRYGMLVDTSDPTWVHKGFRASAVSGKVPLKEGNREVARIDSFAIFRDAHPEAVYLGHDLRRYRVVSYKGDWKKAIWEHPTSDFVLGKWLRIVTAINVSPENRQVTTRGKWNEQFSFYQSIMDLPEEATGPAKGLLKFGIWDNTRKWQGYTEIDLTTKKSRKVSLGEVTQRFQKAVQSGQSFPFLFDLSYRTLGWEWNFGAETLAKIEGDKQRSLGDLTGSILEHFIADALESRIEDISVELDLPNHLFRALDAFPNGLSAALLIEERMKTALSNCVRTLSKFAGRGSKDKFAKYVLELCRWSPDHSAKEVLNVVQELQLRWAG